MGLEIRIERGTHQIGGSAIIVDYEGESVIIDIGANLDPANSSTSDEKLIEKIFGKDRTKKYAAVLFTHYHGDHIGLYKKIPEGIPMYIGPTAKKLMKIVAEYTDRYSNIKGLPVIAGMKTYTAGRQIRDFRKLRITPFKVDHSAVDSYMFLIEAGNKKVLVTGDFREHGISNEKNQLWRTIDKYISQKFGNIDILITEGTMLSRGAETKGALAKSETELGEKAKSLFENKKYNFVMSSSMNLDTIMEVYHNTPYDKLFVCDMYQARLMMESMENEGRYYSQYRAKKEADGLYKKICIIGNCKFDMYRDLQNRGAALKSKGIPQLYFKKVSDKEVSELGFVMLVRPNRFADNGPSIFERIYDKIQKECPDDVNMIYSQWRGYLSGNHEDKDIVRFIGGHAFESLHTSGHAYCETIEKMFDMVKPSMIIPMHTECADEFVSFERFRKYKDKVNVLNDGEILRVI